MNLHGTDYNTDVVKTLTLGQFSKQHEGLPYFKALPKAERAKALKYVFIELGGTVAKK